MIEVEADKKQTKITFTGEGPIDGWKFYFIHDTGCLWQANLLAAQLDRQLAETLQRLKRQFYRLGVKHGRAKQRLIKDDEFFNDCLRGKFG